MPSGLLKAGGLLALFVVCQLLGCGGKKAPDGLPALYPVTITIYQEGQPLPGASVMLFSDGVQWAVGGATDAEGRAVIRTLGDSPGAPEGTYKVCVSQELVEGGGQSDDPGKPAPPTKFFDLVDLVYKVPETTPLEVTVGTGSNESPPFDVGKAIKKKAGPPAE